MNDRLRVNDHMCTCVTFFGFYPVVLERQEEVHSRFWWQKFWHLFVDIFHSYRKADSLDVELEMEEETTSLRSRLIALVPGTYQEAFGVLPKREALQTGRFHVYSSQHTTRRSMVLMTVKLLFRGPQSDPNLRQHSAGKLDLKIKDKTSVLTAIDGEVRKLSLPVKVRLEPANLRVLRPVEKGS